MQRNLDKEALYHNSNNENNESSIIEKLELDNVSLNNVLDSLSFDENKLKLYNELEPKIEAIKNNEERIDNLKKELSQYENFKLQYEAIQSDKSKIENLSKEDIDEIKTNYEKCIDLEKQISEYENINLELKQYELQFNDLYNEKIAFDDIKNKYKGLSDATKDLVDKLNEFYTPDENGELKKVTKVEREELLKKYQNVADKTVDVTSLLKKDQKSDLENKIASDNNYIIIANIAKAIEDYAFKDIRAIIKMKDEATLPDVIKNGRIRTIDITGQDIENVGGNLSDRQVIEENGKKAVFTEEKSYNFVEEVKSNIEKYSREYPEYKEYFEMFDEKSKCYNFPDILQYKWFDKDGRTPFNYQDLIKNRIFPSDFDNLPKLEKALSGDSLLCKVMCNYLCDAARIGNTKCFNRDLGINQNEDISERNSAMSVVAELLGMGNIICHSEPVYIKNGDKTVKGTLMDFAEGTDLNTIKPTDPIASYSGDEIKVTAECKKQISDLQILDLICGNLDRHSANLFYKYDLSDPKNPKITGVQGIDNDCSFVTENQNENSIVRGSNQMVGLYDLVVIDKDTKNKIQAVTPAMLRLSLKGLNINEKSIDKFIERFEYIQAVLNSPTSTKEATYENGQIKLEQSGPGTTKMYNIQLNVIKDDDMWEDLKIEDVNDLKHAGNLFKNVKKDKLGGAKEMEDYSSDGFKISNEKLKSERSINNHNKIVKKHIKKLTDNSKLFRSSNEYRKIEKVMQKLDEMKMNIQQEQKPEYFIEYSNLMQDAMRLSQEYLDKKEREKNAGAVFKQYTLERIKAVTELRDEMFDTIDEITKASLGPYNQSLFIEAKMAKQQENEGRKNTPEYLKHVENANKKEYKTIKDSNEKLTNDLKNDLVEKVEKDMNSINKIDKSISNDKSKSF